MRDGKLLKWRRPQGKSAFAPPNLVEICAQFKIFLIQIAIHQIHQSDAPSMGEPRARDIIRRCAPAGTLLSPFIRPGYNASAPSIRVAERTAKPQASGGRNGYQCREAQPNPPRDHHRRSCRRVSRSSMRFMRRRVALKSLLSYGRQCVRRASCSGKEGSHLREIFQRATHSDQAMQAPQTPRGAWYCHRECTGNASRKSAAGKRLRAKLQDKKSTSSRQRPVNCVMSAKSSVSDRPSRLAKCSGSEAQPIPQR